MPDLCDPRPVLEIEGLRHRLYDPERDQEFVVRVEPFHDAATLHSFDGCLAFMPGQFVTILGPNACGKSTLISVLGLLRQPSSPETVMKFMLRVPGRSGKIEEHDIVAAWKQPRRIEELRRRHLGFALQSGELLPELTVRENIALPVELNGGSSRDARKRVDELLAGFGLLKGDAANRVPNSRVNKISGGEYQRVALARAISHRPSLVFVDEPTASLNQKTAREALGQLRQLQEELRTVVVMITHDEVLAHEFSDAIVRMEAVSATSGRVRSFGPNVRPAVPPPLPVVPPPLPATEAIQQVAPQQQQQSQTAIIAEEQL